MKDSTEFKIALVAYISGLFLIWHWGKVNEKKRLSK